MFQDPQVRRVIVPLALIAMIALGAYSYAKIKEARYMYSGPVTISVTGEGEATAIPDIATFNFTVQAKEADAASAQKKVTETMQKIKDFLKEKGVEDKDINTENLDLSPWYEEQEYVPCTPWGCPPYREPKVAGYQVNQTVSVKVRKIDDAGAIVGGIGELGAQNISSLSFTIDDETKLVREARDKAIEDAKAEAQKLADKLGVRIVRMTGYWENNDGYYPPIEYDSYSYKAGMAEEAIQTTAEIPVGEDTITMKVDISYEVR